MAEAPEPPAVVGRNRPLEGVAKSTIDALEDGRGAPSGHPSDGTQSRSPHPWIGSGRLDALARPRLAALWLPLLLSLALAPAAAAAPQPRVESSLRADGTTVIRYVAPPGQDNELLLRVRAEALDPYKRQQGILNDTGIDFYDVGADGISFKGRSAGPRAPGWGAT